MGVVDGRKGVGKGFNDAQGVGKGFFDQNPKRSRAK